MALLLFLRCATRQFDGSAIASYVRPGVKKVMMPRMTGQAFLRSVRELAAQSRSIFIARHARQRMIQRGFTDEDVQQALLRGQI